MDYSWDSSKRTYGAFFLQPKVSENIGNDNGTYLAPNSGDSFEPLESRDQSQDLWVIYNTRCNIVLLIIWSCPASIKRLRVLQNDWTSLALLPEARCLYRWSQSTFSHECPPPRWQGLRTFCFGDYIRHRELLIPSSSPFYSQKFPVMCNSKPLKTIPRPIQLLLSISTKSWI